MARISAGVTTSHVPAIGATIDHERTAEPYWAPMFTDAIVPLVTGVTVTQGFELLDVSVSLPGLLPLFLVTTTLRS